MKIELKEGVDHNESAVHSLWIDGAEAEYIQDLSECPEDAHIGRDLIDGNDIVRYIQMGYEAAKKGEEIEVTYSELEND